MSNKKQQFDFILKFLQGNLNFNAYADSRIFVSEYDWPERSRQGVFGIIEIWDRKTNFESYIHWDDNLGQIAYAEGNSRHPFSCIQKIPIYQIIQLVLSRPGINGKSSLFSFRDLMVWAASDDVENTLVSVVSEKSFAVCSFHMINKEVAKTVYAADPSNHEILFDYFYERDSRFSEFVDFYL